ncbi:MAG TPA: molybdate ABC transporter substrate-binding protein, partial [Campylobacterales bacterium]|nr:molybdate ABC transporter substrate-binding protein [Campylobacterales bacterium]
MKFKIAFLLLLSSFTMAETIKVAVAANVSYAMEDLKKEFNKLYPDVKVQITLGSTGKLTAQIKNGAPYEMLLAANMMYPKSLYEKGFAITRPLIYAQGSLALISAKKYD